MEQEQMEFKYRTMLLVIILSWVMICLDISLIRDTNNNRMSIEKNTQSINSIEIYFQECKNEIESMKEEIAELNNNENNNIVPIEIITESEVNKELEEITEYKVPNISSHIKYFTDYRCYNLQYTPHYRLQQVSWTDEQGLRRFNNDYIVALGSYYSTNIGDRFEVTLDTGMVFTIILGDGKWDADCDELCMYMPCFDYEGNQAANLLEFIIDEDVLDAEVYDYGDLNCMENFKGSVTKMRYLGRDKSQDWDAYE